MKTEKRTMKHKKEKKQKVCTYKGVIALCCLVGGVVLFSAIQKERMATFEETDGRQSSNKSLEKKTLRSGDIILTAEVAKSIEEQSVGLGNREYLPEREGMLFILSGNGPHRFWMKNVQFPLDMLWIDKNKKIVLINHNIPPESYPETFIGPPSARYVLEVQGGYSKKKSLKIGDFWDWK